MCLPAVKMLGILIAKQTLQRYKYFFLTTKKIDENCMIFFVLRSLKTRRDHGVLLIIFYVENLDVGSWGVENDVGSHRTWHDVTQKHTIFPIFLYISFGGFIFNSYL